MTIHAKITGLPELKQILRSIPDKLRRRVLRNALAAGARIVRDEAKRRAPIMKLSTYVGQSAARRGIAKPGTMRKAISVRTSKASRREGNVGVFVNVKPARGASRGRNNPNDPFYWRWINWGWNPANDGRGTQSRSIGARMRRESARRGDSKKKGGAYFLEAGATRLNDALQAFVQRIGPEIKKLDRNPKDPL